MASQDLEGLEDSEERSQQMSEQMSHIESRAEALRQKINPLTIDSAHRDMWSAIRPRPETVPEASRRVDLPPAPFEDFLVPKGLKLGAIPGDGKCQYSSFSRAIFSDLNNHEELRELAADFLLANQDEYAVSIGTHIAHAPYACTHAHRRFRRTRTHTNRTRTHGHRRYVERVSQTELLSRYNGGQLESLEDLVGKGLIGAPDYVGWCMALKRGLIWGQDFTLEAMCKLMHTEVR